MTISSAKRILVTGGDGQIASALKKLYPNMLFYGKQDLDITNQQAIEQIINLTQPHCIINTAAYTAVDNAESDITNAMAINVDGARNLALSCHANQIHLIHLSTDYVFDGKADRATKETDVTYPVNQYGKSKLSGELAIKENCNNYIILRVSGVFSEFGNNFVKTILRLATTNETLRIVGDQTTCPTYADDIAKTIFAITNHPHRSGIYHYCSKSATSWFNFASAIIDEANKHQSLRVCQLNNITTAEYPTAAQRPATSVLNCEKIFSDFHITQPSWQSALETVVPTLLERSKT